MGYIADGTLSGRGAEEHEMPPGTMSTLKAVLAVLLTTGCRALAADPFVLVGTVTNTTVPRQPITAPVRMAFHADGACALTISPPLIGSGTCTVAQYDAKSGHIEITSKGVLDISWSGTVNGAMIAGTYKVELQSGSFQMTMVSPPGRNLDTILASIQEHPQIHCPVMGDTVTITGQVSIRYVNGLNLPELRAKTFPNRLQPICILVEPYIGAGVGRVDRVAGVAHIWLASPKQRDAHGNIDWTRPEPIATGIVLELAGKLIAQGVNRLSDSGDPLAGGVPYEVVLEVSSMRNVDAEINNAVNAWKDDCLKWLNTQLSPDATAAWKNPPRAGQRPNVRQYIINPFASTNGIPEPECAARVEFNGAKGGYFGLNLARWPYVITNLGTIAPAQ